MQKMGFCSHSMIATCYMLLPFVAQYHQLMQKDRVNSVCFMKVTALLVVPWVVCSVGELLSHIMLIPYSTEERPEEGIFLTQ